MSALRIARNALLVIILFLASNSHGAPRSPGPPMPESPPIFYEGFDEYYFGGATNSQLTVGGFVLDESWSGYALDCSGETVAPFIIPALNPDGSTNISSDTSGAFRYWIDPFWSSQSASNGAGPGITATLLQFDAVSGGDIAFVWSLDVSADGNTLALHIQTSAGIETAIELPISWQAGQPHCVVLDYSAEGTALFVDGSLAARGDGLPSIPTSLGQLVLGSRISGANPAGAEFDEFYSFHRFLSASDIDMYYKMTSGQAALGPVAASGELFGGGHSEANFGRVYDPDHDMSCSPGGPVYITNVLATLATNGSVTLTFDIQGGTNGIFYDIFASSALSNSLPNYQWTWLGQGLTCNTYTFTNQPFGVAFYILELSAETMVVAFGQNASNQCNVPYGLSNAVAVAGGGYFSLALLNNGKVIAWGGDGYGETNIPSVLTNVTGIAAGYLHGVALLGNGSVTNWGTYWDGQSTFCSVTNRSMATAPPTSNVVAVAAGLGQDLALMSNGTVYAWGETIAYGTQVPTNLNLTNVAAIACGWGFNVTLSSNGTLTAWGNNEGGLYNLTNVPTDLITNVAAISAGGDNSLALRKNGTVEAWGESNGVVTNIPAGLSNVVAVATGGNNGMALQANGTLVNWGYASWTNIPTGMAGVKSISAGLEHSVVVESGILTPVIFTQPANQYAPAGGNVTFSAAGEGVAGVQYQWQFNGTNIFGATNSTLALTNVGTSNNGSYQVIISSEFGTITSSVAAFTLIVPPKINSIGPPAAGTNWIGSSTFLSVAATTAEPGYPLTYQWKFNGTNLAGQTYSSYEIDNPVPTSEGTYTVVVANAAGSTNITWNVLMAFPGMVEAWGDDANGQTDRPLSLANATGIAAGEFQSVAVTDSESVVQWGNYSDGTNVYSVTNTSYATLPPTNGVVSVAAGLGQAMALMTNGTVKAWGWNGDQGKNVPSALSNVTAIACGWKFGVAVSNGLVVAWGDNTYGQLNVPAGLSNVTAIAANTQHTLALLTNGTVKAWGYSPHGETNVPAGLSNVVAIAAGQTHNLALIKSNGCVVAWGFNDFGQTNVPPAATSNVMAIAAGYGFSVALKNDGTLVEWGDNSSGQATVPGEGPTIVAVGTPPSVGYITNPPIVVKMIAAGGNHTIAAIFSPVVQYPIDVSKDLLLIYNTNSLDSSNVWYYYLNHRPMVSAANVLGVGCTNGETIAPTGSTNSFTNLQAQLINWLASNPTKRPQYVVIFPQIPSRVSWILNAEYDYLETNSFPSVQYYVNALTSFGWRPFVTSINMDGSAGTNSCVSYINKIIAFASNSPSKLFISARLGGYGNTNWVFDDSVSNHVNSPPGNYGYDAKEGVLSAQPSASVVFSLNSVLTRATNLAAYYSLGVHNGVWTNNNVYPTNGALIFSGQSQWYAMTTDESYSGLFEPTGTSSFIQWFASNAFGGTNYSNTPVGAFTHVDEPGTLEIGTSTFFGFWASGTSFASCAWNAYYTCSNSTAGATKYPQVVGDPFTRW